MRLCLLVSLCSAAAFAQTGTLDGNKSLFTVLAAINAAGYDADLGSNANHPLREIIRDEIARRSPRSIADVKDFRRQHRQEDPAAELKQYVSFALLTEGPPKFGWKLKEYQIPPDVQAMKELAPILERFHEEAGVEELWKGSQEAINKILERYQGPAIRAINEVSAYLRTPMTGAFQGRRFQLVVDVLGPPNRIYFLPFLDEYYLVVTNSVEPHYNDIRHSYAQYLLDPMVTRWAEKIDEKKGVGDYALGAPFLPEYYKRDFLLLATKCLIKAMEARLTPGAAKKQEMVEQAMKEGYVLTAHFAEQLPLYEKQETAMKMYFPNLISSIDPVKEEGRLEKLEFATERRGRKAVVAPPPPPKELSPAEKALAEAEELYAKRSLEEAGEIYRKALGLTQQSPLQGKAYYGLARIAALRRDPETAEKMFLKALDLGPPPQEKSWTLVYLGRLSGAAQQFVEAAKYYQSALGVDGASPKAKEAAEKGLREVKERQQK